MEPWKAMLAVSAILLVFAVVVSLFELPLTGPAALGLLFAAGVGSVVFYVVTKRAFRFGESIGESLRDED